MGPIGSGKSVACCMEIYLRSIAQEPDHDNIRRSRWLVVRNTLPELEMTTIKTWKDWFPPGDVDKGGWGRMTRKPPYTHYMEFSIGDGTKVELEVQFLALDKPEDVKKLLSYECSGIWFNEARELKKEIIDAGTGRVGRYPSIKDGGCTRPCIIMDTNPPDDSHWWYKLAEEGQWAVNADGQRVSPDMFKPEERWEFFQQPSGLDSDAENLENLNQPKNYLELTFGERRAKGRGYYTRMLPGKTKEWINVYVHGHYGTIRQGQPVYGNAFNTDTHIASDGINVIPSGKIYIGVDCSGRHPAAVFAQRSSTGQIQIVRELCILEEEGLGAVQFSRRMKAFIAEEFPQHDLYIWGDPAGGFRTQNDERTYFDILRAQGLIVRPSPGLRIPDRLETVLSVLGKLDSEGRPYFMVSPECAHLIRGFQGGYRYRKLKVSGDDMFSEKPEKNRFADVQDGLQYLLCGMGEYNLLRGGRNQEEMDTVVMTGWNVW